MAHSSLRAHRKIFDLCEVLGIEQPHAVGYLVHLWWSVYDTPKVVWDGILTNWTEQNVARCAMWKGEPKVFVDGLVLAGFVDRSEDGKTLAIHDYERWAPEFIKKRWDRMGWIRPEKRKRLPTAANGPHRETSAANGSYLTQPNVREPNETLKNAHAQTTGHALQQKAAAKRGKAKPKTKTITATATAKAKTREPNPIWDAVVSIWWPTGLPDSQNARIGKLVKDFGQLGATPDEIKLRFNRSCKSWGRDKSSGESVAKHWGEWASEPEIPGTQRGGGGPPARKGRPRPEDVGEYPEPDLEVKDF